LRLKDEIEKQAALTSEAPVFCLIPHLCAPHITPIFTSSEEEQLKKLRAVRTEQGKMGSPRWEGNDLKASNERIPYHLHQGSHWGPQAMCDAVL
jgi:hypothetical protein